MRNLTILMLFVLLLGLAACGGNGGGEEATPAGSSGGGGQGDAAAGQALFNQATIGSTAGCASCHSVEAGTTLVGPSLAGIGTDAATDVPGKTAEEYLHESIVQPDAVVVEGFPSGVMPHTYGEELSDQQINDLVAYLLTLK